MFSVVNTGCALINFHVLSFHLIWTPCKFSKEDRDRLVFELELFDFRVTIRIQIEERVLRYSHIYSTHTQLFLS